MNLPWIIVIVLLFASATASLIWFLLRLSRRSGVAEADLVRGLPGDNLLSAPDLLADRAADTDAPPERIWLWIVQLGKDRAGWYFPAWAERWMSVSWRGAHTLEPQSVQVGET